MSLLTVIKQKAYRLLKGKLRFERAEQYWEERYARGYNSGAGSYGELGAWKAATINTFIAAQQVERIVDFGCGDGHIASLLRVPDYLGLDVSRTAIEKCRKKFRNDSSKAFKLLADYNGTSAELTLSLDVIFHIIADNNFEAYLKALFAASSRYVMIYSSDVAQKEPQPSPHFKHRKFTTWVSENRVDFTLVKKIPNAFQFDGDEKNSSCSNFYIYQRTNNTPNKESLSKVQT